MDADAAQRPRRLARPPPWPPCRDCVCVTCSHLTLKSFALSYSCRCSVSVILCHTWERVHRHGRAEGSLGPPPVVASVNLVPLLWTGVPTPSTPVDRQDPLPIFRCPGNASCCARVFPDHLITYLTANRGQTRSQSHEVLHSSYNRREGARGARGGRFFRFSPTVHWHCALPRRYVEHYWHNCCGKRPGGRKTEVLRLAARTRRCSSYVRASCRHTHRWSAISGRRYFLGR